MDNIFIKTCENNNIIDQFFIRDYVDEIVKTRNLSSVLEYTNFIKYDKTTLGDYTEELKELRINMSLHATIMLNRLGKNNIYQLNQSEKIILNLEILKTLLHELEHAYQASVYNKMNRESQAIEKIIESNLDLYNNPKNKIEISDIYDNLPIEHNAEIEALKKANQIIENSEIKNLITNPDYTYEEVEKLLKKNYNDKSIVEIYLEKTNQNIDDYNYKILTKEQKENFGFPLM